MCRYLPDLFVCASQIFAKLNSCNWIKLPKTFSRKTRRTTWKEMIYILRTKEIGKLEGEKGRKFENEDFVKDGSDVHIFGCINFPSERRTFDGCVNPPNVQQLLQFRFRRCIDAAVTFRKIKSFCIFLESAGLFIARALKGWWEGKFAAEGSSFTTVLLTFDRKLAFFLLCI